ncbi:hypothetical protein A2U01_0094401, partial [Trifolium medium]|nr:hypothetical protein [Trifolium medium]
MAGRSNSNVRSNGWSERQRCSEQWLVDDTSSYHMIHGK